MRHLIIMLLLICLFSIGCGSKAPTQVILVTVDTLRADRLGAIGEYPGTTFTECYAASSWTFPSMVSIVTGEYPGKYQEHGEQSKLGDDAVTVAEILRDANIPTGFISNNILCSNENGYAQGYDFSLFFNNERAIETVHEAERWLERQDGSFFLHLHFMDPHLPYYPPRPLAKAGVGDYDGRFDLKFGGEVVQRFRDGEETFTKEERDHIKRLYDLDITYFAEHYFGFRKYVQDNFPNATLIFTSDHGEEFWEHSGMDHGHTMYNELLHVPLVITGKDWDVKINDTIVSQVDIAPTILDIYGIEAPDYMQGFALQAIADGRDIFHEGTLYGEDLTAITSAGFRMIVETHNPEIYELYNVIQDPAMQTNLAGLPKFAVLASELRRKLERFMYTRATVESTPREFSVEDEEVLRNLGYLGGD